MSAPIKYSEKERIRFVINPYSGPGRKKVDDLKSRIESCLNMDRYDADYRVTSSPGHACSITEEGLKDGIGIFVAVGGDGTVNEVGSVLCGTDALMGIIPAGSGNGLAHHMKIPVKVVDAVGVINRKKTEALDTCLVNDVFFVSIAGIGFDARVARQFARSGNRGFSSYARIAIREYFSYKPGVYKLRVDGKARKVSAFFISFANSNQFGYNARIAPGASLTDGKVDVCIVRKPPVSALPSMANLMFRRKIDRSRYLETFRAKQVQVERKQGRTVNIDGEAVRMPRKLDIRVRPASLNLIVP